MSNFTVIVLGGTGLIGSSVCERLARDGAEVVAVHSRNYASHAGRRAEVLINCNGNSFRYKAAENPRWDFDASVVTVERSLFDFDVERYIYMSTVDVYNDVSDPSCNGEAAVIDAARLYPYAFHKWLAERLVERFAKWPLILRTGTVIGPASTKGPLFDLLQHEPLHMSVESELSFIDTATIADVVSTFVSNAPARRIINVTGSGPAKLHALCAEFSIDYRVAPQAEKIVYHYHVDNAALRESFDIATSYAMAARLLTDALKS